MANAETYTMHHAMAKATCYSYEKSILRKKSVLPTKRWSLTGDLFVIFAIYITILILIIIIIIIILQTIFMVCILVTRCILTVDFLLSFLNPLFLLVNTVLWHPIRISVP